MYYFAYGSNMAAQVMAAHCPGYELIGPACLDDYRLAFNRLSQKWGAGVADVVASPGSQVWGVLYAIDGPCRDALDIKESYGTGYTRLDCTVRLSDETRIAAFTYTVIHKLDYHVPPSADYRATMLAGAGEHDLPADYIAQIQAVE
jgi:gamma-glutamylcyclotransferase (GGCT)/AIG2-like uncharacterized protein YtfP